MSVKYFKTAAGGFAGGGLSTDKGVNYGIGKDKGKKSFH